MHTNIKIIRRITLVTIAVVVLSTQLTTSYAIASVEAERRAINKGTIYYAEGDTVCTQQVTTKTGTGGLDKTQTAWIGKNQAVYQKVAAKYGIQWQIIAALHFQEYNLVSDKNPKNGQGVYQLYSLTTSGKYSFPSGPITMDEFERQTDIATAFFLGKIKNSQYEDQIKQAKPEAIWEAFYKYNGVAPRITEMNRERAGVPSDSGPDAYWAAYVTNNLDAQHKNMLRDASDVGVNITPSSRDGAYTFFLALGGVPGQSSGAGDFSCSGATSIASGGGPEGYDLPGEGQYPMAYYSQRNRGTDKAVQGYYGNFKYGIGTIDECGCGPTSYAMVISTLTGRKQTPDTVAQWAADNDGQIGNGHCGSNHFWVWAAAENKFGVIAKPISFGDIKRNVGPGKIVMIGVSGAFPGTDSNTGGHLMVLRKVSADKYYLADPYADGWRGEPKETTSRIAYSESDLRGFVKSIWAMTAQ